MTREQLLLSIIKEKYKSLRSFSIAANIPNSTLSSMFKKGLGGTSAETLLKVCSILELDMAALFNFGESAKKEDYNFFSKYLSLNESSRELVRLVAEHQFKNASKQNNEIYEKPQTAKELVFPTEATLETIRIYTAAASAGIGDYIDDSDYDEVTKPSQLSSEVDFGITINGDSMMPKICDGDVVWVKEQESLEENQIGVFVLNGNSLCKKLVNYGNRFYLRSLNEKYKDIPIGEFDTLKVIGRVLNVTPYPAY